jgi:hypothetical protein
MLLSLEKLAAPAPCLLTATLGSQQLLPDKDIPTGSSPASCVLSPGLQNDGDVVILNNSSQLTWHTNTAGYATGTFKMQTDSNLVLTR